MHKLEKEIENEPEYGEIKHILEKDPEMKLKYIKELALKRSQMSPLPRGETFVTNEYSSFTSKNKPKGSRGWSEVKSNPTGGSEYSFSVTNHRYKLLGLDDNSRKEYFHNLKVIKKLQQEKKKREKLVEFVESQKTAKEREDERRKQEEEDRKLEQKQQQLLEWKEK